MKYFLDTEFNGFGGELISLALVREDGRLECYVAGMTAEPPIPWVAENVIPIVEVEGAKPEYIRNKDFGPIIASELSDDPDPIIVADWPDDIAYFCKALITGPGEMVSIPGIKFEIIRVDAYPTTLPGAVQHNALWDARALRSALLGRD